MPQKAENLSAFDWDDTELQHIFEQGLKKVKKLEGEYEKPKGEHSKDDKTKSKKKNGWKVGDFCRTVYEADGLLYEAKVVNVSGEACTVEFLGYDEEADVDVGSLFESHGKKARRKQIKKAHGLSVSNADGSISSDAKNEESVSSSPGPQTHSKKKRSNKSRVLDRDTTAAENTVHSVYTTPNEVPTAVMPPVPPMPQIEMVQNPSLRAMMTSWYMAGYYTGLHQAQQNSQYCYRPSQNVCCYHPH